MDYKTIQKQIDTIEDFVKAVKLDEYPDLKPCLNVFEFNKIVDTLKIKMLKSDSESDFFKNVFNNESYYENISSYLEQTRTNLYYQFEKSGINPELNRKIQDLSKELQDIIDILVLQYETLNKAEKKQWLFSKAKQKQKIRQILKRLADLKDELQKILHYDSKLISNVILKNFKTIFTFFSNCIRIARSRHDELLLIEIADISDRIMDMIKPVFSNKSLSVNELIYHYLMYELRELKATAIGQKLA